ncbi:Serine/threonine-protein kinase [Achaetomium macrosporum]|uniref:non-specific serine/threonine protein kinase n=1 Tax=Achaetomium macrosporum TaxID=79813 RepID=A0AAN7H3S1_9PEZI|nr:Serine/threonine-protein kinase [Achaetomium macrosporum]
MNSLAAFVRRHLRSSRTDAETETNAAVQESQPSEEHSRDQSPPRVFPSSGFELIDSSVKIEEEAYSWYSVKNFYPAAIGEVFRDTYQVVAKLGYGSSSTTWLCRDLRKHRYVTIKIYAANEGQPAREVAALKHINSVLDPSRPVKHIGATRIRTLLDQFEISRPKSSRTNLCLVFEPLGISLGDARKLVYDGRISNLNLVKGIVWYMLQALDFLHRKAKLVHGDIQEDNIMFEFEQKSDLREVEEAEMTKPSPRKVYKDHTIYASRLLEPGPALPVLCDFGEARFGSESYGEEAMPDLYRAPEILLRLEWTEKIDIWALGLVLWTLVEGSNLFTDNKSGRWKSALPHMARMISLLGPPPEGLLADWRISTPVIKRFFDKDGRFKKGHLVVETSLEAEATALEGEAKADFLRFLRRFLEWDQDKRPSAQELLKDPWLTLSDDPDSEEEEGS